MDLHKNYDQAKKEVAIKHGYESWAHLLADQMVWKSHDPFHEEAAELYAQWMCNEAVKADRDVIFGKSYFDSEIREQVVQIDVTVRPLPFPQQPDER